jgi:hypothetical protein
MEESPWKSERVPGEVEISIGRAGDGPDPVVCLHGITAQHRAFTSAARRVGPARGLSGLRSSLESSWISPSTDRGPKERWTVTSLRPSPASATVSQPE